MGSSNVANNIVENFEFVDLLETLDLRYPVRARSKELNYVLIEAKITTHLENANKISICCEVWLNKALLLLT